MVNPLTQYFGDIAEGTSYTTRRRTITEADVVNWCCMTADWHPIHTDIEYAEATRFKQRLVPGMLVFSVCGGMWVPAENNTAIAAYGVDRLRFTNPTFIGDTVKAELVVEGKRPKDDGSGVVELGITIDNGRHTVIVATQLALISAGPP
jgi:3-hydroxybutyryl-CoA dehydratase